MNLNFLARLIFCILFSQSVYAVTVDKIISFGDSLTDNGNIFNLTKTAHEVVRYFPVIPMNPPYYLGRFTNGPVWAENLAQAIGVPLADYAYAGAWAEGVWDSGQVIPFDLGMQVNFYLVNAALDFHKDKHLYTIWIGSNDYISGRSDTKYATNNTVSHIKKELEWLIYYGGKNFLIFNLPDLSQVPQARMFAGEEYTKDLKENSREHNQKIVDMIAEVKQANPNVNILLVDVTHYFDEIIHNTEQFNNLHKTSIKNVTDACYGGGYYIRDMKLEVDKEIVAAKENKLNIDTNPILKLAYRNGKLAELGYKQCDNPDTYVFWDLIHPTKIIHESIALLALQTLHDADVHA